MGNAGIPFLAINALTNLLFQMELRRHHSHSSTSTGNGMSTALWGTHRVPTGAEFLLPHPVPGRGRSVPAAWSRTTLMCQGIH